MSAAAILILVLCIFALAYRYYSAFLAARLLVLDDTRLTPAQRLNDGQNYHPTNKWVLFGHHFAAISGAGPLIGPVLAAQFGYLPGLLWLVVGVVIAGAVQDFVVLVLSIRHDGKSLAEIVRAEFGPIPGLAATLAILFVLVVALAGLGVVVVHALADSAWGTFTVAMTIPIAFLMGLYTYKIRPGRIGEATAIGVVLLLTAVVMGERAATASWGHWFLLSKGQLVVSMAIYGFVASVLPIWLLLCPRDYLSSFLKIGTIGLLVVAVFIVNPALSLPAVTEFVHGGGPILPGKVFPYLFITILCGAISGFHSLVASGTTPKMIERESHARMIGYGAMLVEALVGVVALIAVAHLQPGDYFAINVSPEKFRSLEAAGYHIEELPVLEAQVQEKVAGRSGGAVSLAVGMAKLFSGIPGLGHMLAYWYHFAILFEALFILTVIDTGTRIGRFLVQEFLGLVWKPFGRPEWMPGTILSSFLVVGAWALLLATGSIATLWPMFGIANQLLAVLALSVGTAVLSKQGRGALVLATFLPLCVVAITTTAGAWALVFDQFIPLLSSSLAAERFRGAASIIGTIAVFACAGVAIGGAARGVWRHSRSRGALSGA